MTKLCGECRYLDIDDIEDGKALCTSKKERKFADCEYAEKCRNFFKASWGETYIRKDAIATAEKYQKEHREYQATGCFITTAVVNILGMEDTRQELMTLRKFRKNILQTEPIYRELLLRYDLVGPIISRMLASDENRTQIAIDLFNIYIKGCVSYINMDRPDLAVTLYTEMVENLMEHYSIKEFIPEQAKECYDQTSGGHGAIAFKPKQA